MKQFTILLLFMFFVVNALAAPYGTPIKPVDDIKVLKAFAEIYEHSDKTQKMENTLSLTVEKGNTAGEWSTGPHFRDTLNSFYLLYQIDINNDGQPKWVLVSIFGGTMNTSEIRAVYVIKDHALQTISFDKIICSNFNLAEMSQWYLFTADPVFTLKDGKVVMNFYRNNQNRVCSYVWQHNKVTLVHGKQSDCISVQKTK